MLLITVLFPVAIVQNYFCYLAFGSRNFIDTHKAPYFIDKTLLIKEFISNPGTVIVAAPNGFGKTTNLDMLRLFLSNNNDRKLTEDVFQNTKISREEMLMKMHFGNHPVIYCSFKPSFSVTEYNSIVLDFHKKLRETFLQHSYLMESSYLSKHDLEELKTYIDEGKKQERKQTQFSNGLYFLSQILEKHHKKKVVVLIDDYDSVILNSVFTRDLDIAQVFGFYSDIFNKALTHNEHVYSTVLVGTTCVSMKPLTELKNLRCVRFLQDKAFEPFFGLTEFEVDELLAREAYRKFHDKKVEMRMWYDGYTDPNMTLHVYNTRSVVQFLESGELKCFWDATAGDKALNVLLEDRVAKQLFRESAENVIIVIRHLAEINQTHMEELKNMILQEMWDEDFSDLYIHLLMEKGYFTFETPWERSGYTNPLTVKFTNIEVCEAIRQVISAIIQAQRQRTDNSIV